MLKLYKRYTSSIPGFNKSDVYPPSLVPIDSQYNGKIPEEYDVLNEWKMDEDSPTTMKYETPWWLLGMSSALAGLVSIAWMVDKRSVSPPFQSRKLL